jgi:hypothetical protein
MLKTLFCENDAPHDSHGQTKYVEVRCSGITDCGLYQHQPHWFERVEMVHCVGVCGCNDPRRGKHSIGEHK